MINTTAGIANDGNSVIMVIMVKIICKIDLTSGLNDSGIVRSIESISRLKRLIILPIGVLSKNSNVLLSIDFRIDE